MKYILVLVVLLLFFGCGESMKEMQRETENEHKAAVLEIARTISLERFGSFTTTVCYVEYKRSTYSGYTDDQGDHQFFYPCLVFAPKYGWPAKREPTTFTIYCSDKSCQR